MDIPSTYSGWVRHLLTLRTHYFTGLDMDDVPGNRSDSVASDDSP